MTANTLCLGLAVCLLMIGFQPASADVAINITGGDNPETSVQGQVDVEAEGTPALLNSVAEISGNDIVVRSKTPGDGGKSSLIGTIVKSEINLEEFKGFVVFQQGQPGQAGQSTDIIDDPNIEEMIEVNGGQTVQGHITKISADAVEIGGKEVPMSAISRLCSPRIFTFVGQLANATTGKDGAFTANMSQLKLGSTTQPVKSANAKPGGPKRCCFFPPIVVPVEKAKPVHHGHIHIVIPI